MELTPNGVKKRVIRGYNTKYGPAGLFVGEHDSEMWATNRYWFTRAERVAPLLEQYNLTVAEPGAYEVNGTVRRATGSVHGIPAQPPDLSKFDLWSAGSYQPGIRVKVAGNDVLVQPDDRSPLYAVYLMTDGMHAGLIVEELAWLSDLTTAPELPEAHRYGDVHVSFHKADTGGVSAVISAEVFKILEPAHYADEGRGDYVPAVKEPSEPVMLALVMAMNFNA